MERLSNWLKKYFIPHDGNEYKPHFLRNESFLVVFLVIIVVELGFLAQVFLVFDKTKFLAAVLPGVLESMTNQERAENNALPLTENTLLTQAAQLKADDMATKGYFAHTSPEGKTPWYWFSQVGYRYSYAGENLAVNFFESGDVAQAWMNSPTHRANIVKKDFTEIGIGVASGVYEGRNTVFVAQLFGAPVKIAPVAKQPTPAPKNTVAQKPPTLPAPKPATTNVAIVTPPPASSPLGTQVLGELTDTPTTATVTPTKTSQTNSARLFIEKLLSSPRQSSAFVYVVIAIIVILALLLAIFIRSEIQHPAIIARGLSLVAVVVVLLIVNMHVIGLDIQIPAEDTPGNLSASAIAN